MNKTQSLTAEPKWRHRSFFDEVDAMVPRYQHPPVLNLDGRDMGAVMYPENAPTQRMFAALSYHPKTGEPEAVEFSMPFQMYARALDANGHIVPVPLKTCQIASEDGTGYAAAKSAEKMGAGFLFLERDGRELGLLVTNPTNMQGEEYAEHCRREWLARRERNAQRNATNEESFKSQALKSAEEMAARQEAMLDKQHEATLAMADRIASATTGSSSAEVEALRADNAKMRADLDRLLALMQAKK